MRQWWKRQKLPRCLTHLTSKRMRIVIVQCSKPSRRHMRMRMTTNSWFCFRYYCRSQIILMTSSTRSLVLYKRREMPIVLSCHQWRKVRSHTVLRGPGGTPDSKPKFKETPTRMYNEDLVTLVQFLAIPQHLQLFAYGERHYMLSDSTMKTVNSCTRKLPGCELFDSFKHHCEATG